MVRDCLTNCLANLYFCTFCTTIIYESIWNTDTCCGSLLLQSTHSLQHTTKRGLVSILTYQDASYGTLTIYMYGLVNWNATSEVLHWTGKRFKPLLFMLLNTQIINSSISILTTGFAWLQEKASSWTFGISNLQLILTRMYRLICLCILGMDRREAFVEGALYHSVLHDIVPCSCTVPLMNNTTPLKLTWWKNGCPLTGITAAKTLLDLC